LDQTCLAPVQVVEVRHADQAAVSTRFDVNGFQPFFIAFFNTLFVIGDVARFAETLGIGFIHGLDAVDRVDDEKDVKDANKIKAALDKVAKEKKWHRRQDLR
jgi:hypothetical protein